MTAPLSRGGSIFMHALVPGTRLEITQPLQKFPLCIGAQRYILLAGGTELYMCGPIRLMDAVRRGWVERELDLPNLRYETFGNSGWYDPEEFIVRVPKLNLEVTVPQGRSMLEALEDAGAEMVFHCRKDECGLCEVRVIKLAGTIDHRDVFYSERQQRLFTKMNCCVSRAVTSATGAKSVAAHTGPAVITIEPN